MTAGPLPLVLTGASGLVGRRLVQLLLAESGTREVTLLVRDASAPDLPASLPAHWRVAQCDLGAAASPGAANIPSGAIVIHLAAATGRLAAATMRRVNVDGTRNLMAAATAAGARHFIFVSSIAADFPNRRWYHYADAKREAEAIVRQGGVPATIVRPTMVFGPGSPVQDGLQRLATGPLPIVLGSGRVVVEPIHVDDLAGLLLALAADPPGATSLIEVGGPERATVRDLLGRMRTVQGMPSRHPWSIPLGPLRLALAMAEPVLGSRLPVTAGQLASFLNHSTAAPNPLVARLLPAPRSLDDMLAAGAMSRLSVIEESAAEFATFSGYLGTPLPGPRATAAYLDALPSAAAVRGDRLDDWLLRLARRSAMRCGIADAYARVARPHGSLRRRLVLTLAVLESTPAWHADYDSAQASSPTQGWLAIAWQGAAWAMRTGVAVLVLAPAHLVAGLMGMGARRG